MYKLILLLSVFFTTTDIFSQNIPQGYILQYNQDFSNNKSINDFRFTYPDEWNVDTDSKNKFLQIKKLDIDSVFRREAIALLENHIFGDFILEADVMLSGENDERGSIFFNIGIKDSSHFYSVILNSYVNGNNPDIIITNGVPGNSVAENTFIKKEFTSKKWHKIRIERNIVDRSINFYLDDMKTPVIVSKDKTFVMGYIAFGTTNYGCRIDNLKIWSQTSIPKPAGFYLKKI